MERELGELLRCLERYSLDGAAPEAGVQGIAIDSRKVGPGGVFIAVKGLHSDGHEYLGQAVANGARVLVVEDASRAAWEQFAARPDVTVVSLPETRPAVGPLAAAFYGNPARDMAIAGVTGTDGKTTTTFLTAAVLEAMGLQTAFLSTAAFRIGRRLIVNDTHLTSPDAIEVQRWLAEARAAGAGAVVIESSSHGLDQGRLEGCAFDVGILTNVTRDHLDYHGTFERYREAKAILFAGLGRGPAKPGIGRAAVLNADDPNFSFFAKKASAPVISYREEGDATVTASDVECHGWDTYYRLGTPAGEASVRLAMPGHFNISNSLAAAGAGYALGATPAEIARGLGTVRGVPGRMERIDIGQPYTVVVDYAHTPFALRQALSYLRSVTRRRLIAVFGCTGDRDHGRREPMGRIAAECADATFVTSEDNWTEDPGEIAAEIVRGLESAGARAGDRYWCILDRRQAIRSALANAQPGDTILVSGMGPQQSMISRGKPVPWDDRQVVREEIEASLMSRSRAG
jgi:UDP-N-acetylmuramoyl-L-alanyl-D-glutamate--2,6-diaminopimelate ligase